MAGPAAIPPLLYSGLFMLWVTAGRVAVDQLNRLAEQTAIPDVWAWPDIRIDAGPRDAAGEQELVDRVRRLLDADPLKPDEVDDLRRCLEGLRVTVQPPS